MEIKQFGLNQVQAKVQLVNAPQTTIVMARGTGKTTGILAPKSVELVLKMPRAKGGFIGKDYPQLTERTLPEIVSVWEKLGYSENHHWRLGKPLADWDKPIIPPISWDHFISWYNGTAIALLPLSVPGIANGLSLQWVLGDEAKFWNPEKLKEILKAVRGLRQDFGHLPEYLTQWFATDKWVQDLGDIQWILDKKKQMDEEKVEAIYTLQLEANELRRILDDPASDDLQLHHAAAEAAQLEEILAELRRGTSYYAEGTSADNIDILGQDYLDKMKKDLPSIEYSVAIENEDPTTSLSGYYPAVTPAHKYESDTDIDLNQGFIIAADYQASIAPIVAAQFCKGANDIIPALHFVREIYTKQVDGKSLKDAVLAFCDKFSNHANKLVYYVYDTTATGRNPFGISYKDLVLNTLVDQGWAVIEVATGKPPEHGIKYEAIKGFYENADPLNLPRILINERHCPSMCESMKRARAIQQGKDTKKDKRYEDTNKYPNYPQELATHFSDVHDQILWATHEQKAILPDFGSSFIGS